MNSKLILEMIILNILALIPYNCSSNQKESFFLDETDSTMITNINNIDLSKNFLLITDNITGCIYFFNIYNGSLVKKIEPNIFISDSIALKFQNIDVGFKRKYVTLKEIFEYKGGEYDPANFKEWIHNNYAYSYFLNDSTVVSINGCSVKSLEKNTNNPTGWDLGSENRAVLMKYNLLTSQITYTPLLENRKNVSFVYTPNITFFSIIPNNDRFLVSVDFYLNDSFLDIDTIYELAQYNVNGICDSLVHQVPIINRNLEKYSSINSIRGVFSKKINDFIFVYSYLPSIFYKNKQIYLKNFPSKINEILKFKDSSNYLKKFESIIFNKQPIADFRIIDIFEFNENILLYISSQKQFQREFALLEYNLNGELIREYPIKYSNKELSIPKIYYNDEKSNNFIIIRKYDEGWNVKFINKISDFNL